MEHHEKINKEVKETVDRDKLEQTKKKHIKKTAYARMKKGATLLNWIGHFCQANSFVLASSGAVCLLWDRMGANGIPFIILCLAGFGLVEYGVGLTNRTFHSMRLDDKVISPIIYPFMIFAYCISTPATYYLTPDAVQLFVTAPELVDTANVRMEGNIMVQTDTSYWHNQKILAINTKKDYWTTNKKRDCKDCPWRLSSKDYISEPYEKMIADVSNAQDSLNKYFMASVAKMNKNIDKANQANEEILIEHSAWCESFGGCLAIGTIIFMVALFLCRWYYAGWERLWVKELEVKVKEEDTQHTPEVVQEVVIEQEVKEEVEVVSSEKVLVNEEVSDMQFKYAAKKGEDKKEKKEGVVLEGEGRKHNRIWCKVDGELRALLIGDLNRHIKGNKSVKKSKKVPYYKELKKKLEAHKK